MTKSVPNEGFQRLQKLSNFQAEKLLEQYTLKEILEANELTEADALQFLKERGTINLPKELPL